MYGPGKPDNEAVIKELLVSRDREERVAGLERLDEEYRELTSGYVRARYRWLSAEEIADIWAQTFAATWENVESRAFRDDGRLDAYLRGIARNKVVTLLRRSLRLEIQAGLDGDQAVDTRENSIDELLEEIEAAYAKLPESEQLLMRIDVYLYLDAGFKWVSLDDLTREFNRQSGLRVPKSTVKSRRSRGRNDLRTLLEQRGHL